jgi:hypothetical protein
VSASARAEGESDRKAEQRPAREAPEDHDPAAKTSAFTPLVPSMRVAAGES